MYEKLSSDTLDAAYSHAQYDRIEDIVMSAAGGERSRIPVVLRPLPAVTRGRLSRALLHRGHLRLSTIVSLRAGRDDQLRESGRALWSARQILPWFALNNRIRTVLPGYDGTTAPHSIDALLESSINIEDPEIAENYTLIYLLGARLSAEWRDFDDAERWLKLADSLLPDSLMVAHERAYVEFLDDRIDSSIERAEHALSRAGGLNASSSAGNGSHQRIIASCDLAYWYRIRGKRNEAAHLLSTVVGGNTSLLVLQERWNTAVEMEDRSTMEQLLDEFDAFGGRASPVTSQAISGCREWYEKTFGGSGTGHTSAVVLTFPFVYQNYHNCAPATISAIARFHGLEMGQDDLASEITWNGTSQPLARSYMESLGWKVREGRLDWESAVSCIDAGLPIAVSLINSIGNGHMVALIGYDRRRNLLIFADPSMPLRIRVEAKDFFDQQDAHGPRATLFLPPAFDPLHAPTLKDETLYDRYHEFETAMRRGDFDSASSALESMHAENPRHHLFFYAAIEYAQALDDPGKALDLARRAAELWPEDGMWSLTYLRTAKNILPYGETLRIARDLAEKDTQSPLVKLEYAGLMYNGPFPRETSEKQLLKALSVLPPNGSAAEHLAVVFWNKTEHNQAEFWYRRAAHIDARADHSVAQWMGVAETHGRIQDLESLTLSLAQKDNVQGVNAEMNRLRFLWRTGRRSEARSAAISLAAQPSLAVSPAVIEELARLLAFWGEEESALRLIGHSGRALWPANRFRLIDDVTGDRGELHSEIKHSLEVIAPAGFSCVDARARQLWRSGFPAEAVDCVRDYITSSTIALMHIEPICAWLRLDGPAGRLDAIRRIVEQHPDHVWLRREYALALAGCGDKESALSVFEDLNARFPPDPLTKGLYADMLYRSGATDKAYDTARSSWRIFGAVGPSAGLLPLLIPDPYGEDKKTVEDLGEILIRLPHEKPALDSWYELAQLVLDQDAVEDWRRRYLMHWHDSFFGALLEARILVESAAPDLEAVSNAARRLVDRFGHEDEAWAEAALLSRFSRGTEEENLLYERGWNEIPRSRRVEQFRINRLKTEGRIDEALEAIEDTAARSLFDLAAQHALAMEEAASFELRTAAIERCLWLAPQESSFWLEAFYPKDADQTVCSENEKAQAVLAAIERRGRLFEGNANMRLFLETDIFMRLGLSDEAESRLSSLDSEDPLVLTRRSRLAALRGDYKAALQYFGLNAAGWSSDLGRGELEYVLERQENVEGLDTILSSISESTLRNASLIRFKAWQSSRRGFLWNIYEKKYSHLYRRIKPYDAAAWLLWGRYRGSESPEDALAAFHIARNLDPEYQAPVEEELFLLAALGRDEEAEHVYETLSSQTPWAKNLKARMFMHRLEVGSKSERLGTLPPRLVNKNKLRRQALSWIEEGLQDPGCSVDDIRAYVSLVDGGVLGASDVRRMARRYATRLTSARALLFVLAGRPPYPAADARFEPDTLFDQLAWDMLNPWFTAAPNSGGDRIQRAYHELQLNKFINNNLELLKSNANLWQLVYRFLWSKDFDRLLRRYAKTWTGFRLDDDVAGNLLWKYIQPADIDSARRLFNAYPSLSPGPEPPADAGNALAYCVLKAWESDWAEVERITKSLDPSNMEGRNQVVVHDFLSATSKYIKDGDRKAYKTVYRSWYSIAWAMPIVRRALESRGMDARRARLLCTRTVVAMKSKNALSKFLKILFPVTLIVLIVIAILYGFFWRLLSAPAIFLVFYALLKRDSKK